MKRCNWCALSAPTSTWQMWQSKYTGHGFSQEDIALWLKDFMVRPVFTAHPTEAARRSILGKLGQVARLLDQEASPTQSRRLAETVDLLWQTDELRLGQPEPL